MSEFAFGITLAAGAAVILLSALLLAGPLALPGRSGRISFAVVGLLLGGSILANAVSGRSEPATVVAEHPEFVRAGGLIAEVNELSDAYREAVAYCRADAYGSSSAVYASPPQRQSWRRDSEEIRRRQRVSTNRFLDRQLRCQDAADRIAHLKPPLSASAALTTAFHSAIGKCAYAYAAGAATLEQVASLASDRSNLNLQSVARRSAEQSGEQIRKCEAGFYAAVARARRENRRT